MREKIGIVMGLMRGGYGLFYAVVVLLAVAYIGINTLSYKGIRLDVISNLHLKAQSLLHIKSIAKMAALCLEKYDFDTCHSDEFRFEEFWGGYELSLDKDHNYWADVYVEGKNLRTSQILRSRSKIFLKDKNEK